MDAEMEKLVDDCEASWPTTKELAFVIDDPLEKLMEKAQKIFKGRHWDTLDALAVRIADAIPRGVTDENFGVAEPIAGAAKKHFSNIEKLRMGLNRPFLDAKKAVDEAAKATVARAEPTLMPIINAVKKIQDRKKREEEEREAARLKKIEDDRLAAEKAHRDMIEAEHAAEKKRLADEAAANRRQADELAAKNRAANDELAELRKQLEKMGRADTRTEVKGTPELAKVLASAPTVGKMVAMDDHGYPILPPLEPKSPDSIAGRFRSEAPPLFADDTPLSPDPQDLPDEPPHYSDDLIVNTFGDAVSAFRERVGWPEVVSQAAKQAVELALFDLCEIAKRLQEWRGT